MEAEAKAAAEKAAKEQEIADDKEEAGEHIATMENAMTDADNSRAKAKTAAEEKVKAEARAKTAVSNANRAKREADAAKVSE